MPKILRKILLDKLFILKDKNFIKVVTGVRRAGKSTLLLQFQELLDIPEQADPLRDSVFGQCFRAVIPADADPHRLI